MAVSFERFKQLRAQGLSNDQIRRFDAGEKPEELEKEPGLLKGLVQGIAKPFIKTGLTTFKAAKGISAIARGDVESLREAASQEAKDFGFFGKVKPITSKKEALGVGAEIGSTFIGGGAIKEVGKTALKGLVKQTAKKGFIEGTKAGALSGFGQSLQKEDVTLGGVLKDTVINSILGGGLGLGLGFAGGKFQSVRLNKIATKTQQRNLLLSNIPDKKIAKATLVGNTVKKDRIASEAVRQGIDEGDVALIKVASPKDKTRMTQMLNIRLAQLTNKRVSARATDVVGDTFISKIAKPLVKLNKDAGQKLDKIARGLFLSGKKVDFSSAVTSFQDDLANVGVKIRKDGTLNFKDSAFEGITAIENNLIKVWNRGQRLLKKPNPLLGHRTKKFVDVLVDFGKTKEGLEGTSEKLLKNFRRNIDGVLDIKFPVYDKANKQFSETINVLNDIGAIMGRKFRIGENFADAQSGLVMRRILSNTKSRADILKFLDQSQLVLQKYGIDIDEDIITQANFADLLEKMLGSEAPTSFLGQIERAGERVSGLGDIARGRFASGVIKLGAETIDVLRNINQEGKINALRALLKAKSLNIFKKGANTGSEASKLI